MRGRHAGLALVLAGGALAAGSASAPAASITRTCSLTATGVEQPCDSWFTGDVSVVWTVVPPLDSTDCPLTRQVTAEGITPIPCVATIAGSTFPAGVTIKIDKTPPAMTGVSARAPDANGWFNHPVTLAFTGTDALSGIASCTTMTFAGPDSAAATISGTCTDVAGLTSAPLAFALKYDATPPSLAVAGEPADRAARLRWSASPDVARMRVVRAPGRQGAVRSVVYKGTRAAFSDRRVTNGRTYRYSVTATDEAGNELTRSVSIRPGVRLLAPASGSRVSRPPVLRWTRVSRARYYNVQLFRIVRGRPRKIRSSWPAKNELKLTRTWRYAGQQRRLVAGRYRWYVWPGRGPRSEGRFGARIGTATFTIVS